MLYCYLQNGVSHFILIDNFRSLFSSQCRIFRGVRSPRKIRLEVNGEKYSVAINMQPLYGWFLSSLQFIRSLLTPFAHDKQRLVFQLVRQIDITRLEAAQPAGHIFLTQGIKNLGKLLNLFLSI